MASTAMEDQARGQRWRILLKIRTLLRFIFKATSKIEEEDENMRNCTRWADLPTDLLERILIRLPPKDVVRACSACTAWTSVLLASPMRLLRLPWLLLRPAMKTTDPFPLIRFLCPNENLIFDIRLPPNICDCRPSGIVGWLRVSDRAHNSYLLNPLNRVLISIPHLQFNNAHFSMSETNIKTNSFPRSLKILCTCHCETFLYVQPCIDIKWITLPAISYDVQDMIYHQNKFFILFKHGGLTIHDLNGPYPTIRRVLGNIFKEAASKYGMDVTSSKSYLLQNSENVYQLLVSYENKRRILGAFRLKMDPDEFFLSSGDNIFPAKEEYYKNYSWKSEWLYDDTILDANQIIFVDDREAIFIPAHVGCDFKYVADH